MVRTRRRIPGETGSGRIGFEPGMVRTRSDLSRYLSQSLTSEYFTVQDDEIRQSSTYIKSYILELSQRSTAERLDLLKSHFVSIESTDDGTLLFARDPKGSAFFVDALDERFMVLHTIAHSEETDGVIKRLTDGDGPGFDRAWLPTQFLHNTHIGHLRGFKFSHDLLASGVSWAADLAPSSEAPVEIPSAYQFGTVAPESEVNSKASKGAKSRKPVGSHVKQTALTVKDSATADRDYEQIRESSVFQARRSLDWIQYRAIDPDGLDINHSLYSHGKITANGTSAGLHMHAVEEVRHSYAIAIREIESSYGIGWASTPSGRIMTGEPLVVRFSQNVVVDNLYSLAKSIFRAARPFRLFGFTHRVAERRLDIEAIDLRTGDEFSVELTPEWMRVFLPRGTCGNVVARLLTNLQHTMDSDTMLYAGDGAPLLAGVPSNER